jgi:hypothetical protein
MTNQQLVEIIDAIRVATGFLFLIGGLILIVLIVIMLQLGAALDWLNVVWREVIKPKVKEPQTGGTKDGRNL